MHAAVSWSLKKRTKAWGEGKASWLNSPPRKRVDQSVETMLVEPPDQVR